MSAGIMFAAEVNQSGLDVLTTGFVSSLENKAAFLPAEETLGDTSVVAAGSERDALITQHLSTVRHVARRIHQGLPQHVEMEDLVSAGMLGLIDAASKFDLKKRVQFKSYAQFRIRGAILDSLRILDWSPRDLRRKGRAVEAAISTLTQAFGHSPAEQEIAAELGMSLSEFQNLLGDLKGLEVGSLHSERSEDSNDEELSYVPGSPAEDPMFRCLQGELRQRLADAITDLPEKERMVLTLYYYEELTMKEIGQTLGVVESRVSQIHSGAVLKLRAKLADLGAKQAKGGGSTQKSKAKPTAAAAMARFF